MTMWRCAEWVDEQTNGQVDRKHAWSLTFLVEHVMFVRPENQKKKEGKRKEH